MKHGKEKKQPDDLIVGYCDISRCWLSLRQCKIRQTRAASGYSPAYIRCVECGGKAWTKEESKKLLEYPVEHPTILSTMPAFDMSNIPIPIPPCMLVQVDFTAYPELYEWLKGEAKDNLRPIEYQILAGLTDLKG